MEKRSNVWHKLLYHGLTRVIAGVVVLVTVLLLTQQGILWVLGQTALSEDIRQFIAAAVSALAVVFAYQIFFKAYEKRRLSELSTRHLFRDLFWGVLLGGVLQTLTVAIIYLNKGYRVIAVNDLVEILPWMGLSISAAVGEEIVFRGIIFRIAEEKLGSYWALVISSLLFGAAHFFGPLATVWSSLSIAVEAGLLLGTAYMLTRNIWFAVAIHFAWDFVQAGIYGVTTSGKEIGKSYITSEITGPELITGGKFGPEVSVQATLFCLAAAIIMFVIAYKRKRIIARRS